MLGAKCREAWSWPLCFKMPQPGKIGVSQTMHSLSIVSSVVLDLLFMFFCLFEFLFFSSSAFEHLALSVRPWIRLNCVCNCRLGQLLEVLDLCIKLFEYPGTRAASPKGNPAAQQPKKSKVSDSKVRLQTLEEAILNRGAAREMLQRHKTAAMSMSDYILSYRG